MSSQTTLAARVIAVNIANNYANSLFDKLSPIFKPFVGQKIIKIDGSLLEKVQKLIPQDLGQKFLSGSSIQVYRDSSQFSIRYTVKSCVNIEGGCSCVYYETSVYIGEFDGQNLKSIHDNPDTQRRIDFTAEEITAKREEYKRLKKLADDAMSALQPFGEYDR